MPTVLIIDDNPAVATALALSLSLNELDAVHAASPQEGLAVLQSRAVDLVIQDMNFSADTTSGAEGEELFRAIRAEHPDLPVILLTAWTHLDTAVSLVKAGAADYLAKPWDDQRLLASVKNLLELGDANRVLARERGQRRRSRDALLVALDSRGLIWADRATEGVLRLAAQVAKSDVSVLIAGPNGAGKEKFAEILQANSAVAKGPFVTLNCGAIPGELIEAELFGAEAGAYTGASKSREGKFEAADGGTLFLDEIGNLPPSGQMKLLRVLETGRFERLGSNRERQVRVRVISATNADLPAMIRAGQFREDLYYRLNVIELRVPPLVERSDDILPLAEYFLAGERRLSAEACDALLGHDWPGNVRELKNVMLRARLLTTDVEIPRTALGLPDRHVVRVHPTLDNEPDRAAIEAAISRSSGVLSQAASALGLSRQALYRRMERFGIARQ